ncbi:MAG: pyrimidine 5'-nucleotidase [Alcaligenaceae bacterium]|nr:pyrimidine 5'-nucleotidase [Alcaligenaceae bacterium]
MRIRYIRRPHAGLSGKVYLLDLDNTLHHASTHILPEINRQMTRYLAEHLALDPQQASELRTQYWLRYGATLLGMMRHHQTNPHHFLASTHRFEGLKKLSSRHGSVPHRLGKLPGLRIMLTNAPRAYAVELCKEMGLYRHLHAVIAIEDMVVHQTWRPKPANILWPNLKSKLKGKRALLVDDTLGHLEQAARHGIQTSWITFPGLGFKPRQLTGKVKHRIRQFEAIRTAKF